MSAQNQRTVTYILANYFNEKQRAGGHDNYMQEFQAWRLVQPVVQFKDFLDSTKDGVWETEVTRGVPGLGGLGMNPVVGLGTKFPRS